MPSQVFEEALRLKKGVRFLSKTEHCHCVGNDHINFYLLVFFYLVLILYLIKLSFFFKLF